MQSATYKDIIDEKIAEWQVNLKKIEDQAGKASSDSQSRSNVKVNELKSAIDAATVQLQTLDARETVGNTMETKDKILEIFNTIDKHFLEFEDKTPYML